MQTKTKSHAQQFQDVFHSLARSRGAWKVWNDFVTLVACGLAVNFDAANRANRDEQHRSVRSRYTHDELGQFARLLDLTVDALEADPDQDFLGEIFQLLELHNESAGQFFTPYNIAKCMALMLCGNPAEEIAEKGFITATDPCCGAGALLIAYANALREQGVNYQRDVVFIAQDIDFTVAMMCFIQLALHGCAGYVTVGDSLRSDPPDPKDVWLLPMGMVNQAMRLLLAEKT